MVTLKEKKKLGEDIQSSYFLDNVSNRVTKSGRRQSKQNKNTIKAGLLQKQLAFFLVSLNKQVWFRNNAIIILLDIKSFRNRAFSVKMAGY